MKTHVLLFCLGALSLWTEAAARIPFRKPIIEDKVVLTSQEKKSSKAEDEPGPDYRLPTSLVPFHYSLRIRPIIDRDYPGVGDKDTARGSVRIQVQCVEKTRRIVMHQKFLSINESYIGVRNLGNEEVVEVSDVEYNEPRDFFIINLASELNPPNEYEISIGYWANVPPNDSLRGLYSEAYFDPLTNQTKVMAVTQLEPLRARQVFPCFDEPTYKAKFDLVIGRTENFTSLANGPLIGTQPDAANPGWYWDIFNTTVPMPTYLFAMAVSEYGFNEASSELYRLPVRVYGPLHLTNEGKAELSANGSAMLMDYFEKKYGVPHGMPKVDSISVPYKGGAMENYGLITYGEPLLMYHEGLTLHTRVRQMYNILAHELGHQWFGNMVTCKWWSDIWLNEGFATYVSYDGVQALWPRFDMMNFMVHDTVNSALKFDATSASHPIHQEAYNAEQIGQNMDTIGYDKGGSIVRLMISFLGEDVFYEGVREYLKLLQDKVAEQDDLFAVLDHAASSSDMSLPKNVTDIMHTWTLQTGFPLVRVKLTESDNSLVFTQEPWQNADARNSKSNVRQDSEWDIPVRYLVQTSQDTGQEGSLWLLRGDENPENVTLQNGSGWILTNPDAGGYYRTLYDEVLAGMIRNQLERNHAVFSVAARVRLLDDQFILGFQEYVPIENGFDFTKYLANETDPTVWFSVFSNLLQLRMLYGAFTVQDSFSALKSYLLPRVESAREKISQRLETASPLEATAESILYSQLADWSCALDSAWCKEYAAQLLREWTSSPDTNPVPVNLQPALYCKMVEINDIPGYEWMVDQYQKPGQTQEQKSLLAYGLGCATSFKAYGAIILGMERRLMEPAHSVILLQGILEHTTDGRLGTLLYLRLADRWINEYGWTVQELVQVLAAGANFLFTEDDVAEVTTVLRENPDIFADSFSNALIAAVKANQQWMTDYNDRIKNWLLHNSN